MKSADGRLGQPPRALTGRPHRPFGARQSPIQTQKEWPGNPRHWEDVVTVAAFRPWRGSRACPMHGAWPRRNVGRLPPLSTKIKRAVFAVAAFYERRLVTPAVNRPPLQSVPSRRATCPAAEAVAAAGVCRARPSAASRRWGGRPLAPRPPLLFSAPPAFPRPS